MDDIIVRSKRSRDQVADFNVVFSKFIEFGIYFNSVKYVFGIRYKKFFGYMVN